MRFFTTTALVLLAVAFCTQPIAHAVGGDRDTDKDPSVTKEQKQAKLAVDKGLKHLASIQTNDGSWRNNVGNKLGYDYQVAPNGYNKPHLGVTAIACMAFMAAGNTPNRGKYKNVVAMGLDFVLKHVDGTTGWTSFQGTRMYSHAFCAMFLAEVYGMTKNNIVREKLRNTVKLIVDSQNEEGSWRYVPHQKESDMSICVCQLQALRAASNVGVVVIHEGYRIKRDGSGTIRERIFVNPIENAKKYVRASYIRSTRFSGGTQGAFRYQINNDGRSSFALTAAGIVALQSMGEYDSHTYKTKVSGKTFKTTINLRHSIAYLNASRPDKSPHGNGRHQNYNYGFWYGHYYAAQAMHQYKHVSPRTWASWAKMNRIHFMSMQQDNGAWLDEVGGRSKKTNAYATAMACLILGIPRGYLPIFQT